MIQYKSLLTLAAACSLSATSFAGGPDAFKVNPAKTNLKWTASKVTGKHEGMIRLAGGSLLVEGKNLTGGSFDIDMSTITCTDIADKETNANFLGHLRSDDFFGVEKFKTAHFEIEKVTPKSGNEVEVSGKMTIKGITKALRFPATIVNDGKSLKAKAKITVDRSEYDVKFRSAKFFSDLGDKLIHDDFIIELDMEAAA